MILNIGTSVRHYIELAALHHIEFNLNLGNLGLLYKMAESVIKIGQRVFCKWRDNQYRKL